MKNFKMLIVLALFASLFNACSKEEDIIEPITSTPPVEEATGLLSMIEVKIEGEEAIHFNFEECAFSDTQKQRTTNSLGTLGGTKNIKRLTTRIYNRNEEQEVETELVLQANFVHGINEGDINLEVMESILAAHNNAESSPFFGLEIGVRKEDLFFTNIKNMFDETGNVMFSYTPNFKLEIKEFEMGYESECLDEELIKIEADFKGTLYGYEFGELADSLNVEIVDLEILFVVD